MKKAIIILLFFLCNSTLIQSSETGLSDTTNFTDAVGKRQGHWIIFNKALRLPGYKDDQKVEEGKFVDSKKTGIWETFFPNNKLKSKVPYINNRQDGYAILYYENGNIKEEGIWRNNRWVGDYKMYHENGQVQQEFKFNAGGKREGAQTYYNENGQKIIEGNWAAGKEAGQLKEFYDNGDLKSEKNFNNGSLDIATVKNFEAKKSVTKVVKEEIATPPPVVITEEKDNLGKQFNGEGYWKLFNSNKQVSKDGVFRKNKLVDGKVYTYDSNGMLIRIAVYKDGKYVGDSIIQD
ncbi:MAG: hypothetical protein ACT4ON_07455 [Bacteroidota bacterium]